MSLSVRFLFLLVLAVLGAGALWPASRYEYRGFWVDTFNTSLNTHADVVAVVDKAKSAKANAIFT
jgi:hypothetical protein